MGQRDPLRYGAEVTTGSQSLVTDLVGFDKRVLEIGCAAGAVTKALAAQGCKVVGIEIDPAAAEFAREHAELVIVGDVQEMDLLEAVGGGFDVVLCADVLEHVLDPATVLNKARDVLTPDGCVVISIPNIAHGDVRLLLSRGDFTYRETGLLDETHVRFYTRDSLHQLLRSGGLVPVEMHELESPLFATELGVNPADFDPELIAAIRADPDSTIYQFVFRAVPDRVDRALQELYERAETSRRELWLSHGERDRLQRRVDELVRENGALRVTAAAAAFELEVARADQRELEALRRSRVVRYSAPVRGVLERSKLASRLLRLRPRRGAPDLDPATESGTADPGNGST